MERDALCEWHPPDRSRNVSGSQLRNSDLIHRPFVFLSGQIDPPGPLSQSGVIPPQNTQGQPTWISETQPNPALGFPGKQDPGNAMTPPQSQSNQSNTSEMSVPPLDRTRFQNSYRHFCSMKKLVISEAALNIGSKRVDLHALHEEVLKLRATGQVSSVFSNTKSVCSDDVTEFPQFLAPHWIETRIFLRRRAGVRWSCCSGSHHLQTIPPPV